MDLLRLGVVVITETEDTITYRSHRSTVILTKGPQGIDGCYIGDTRYDFERGNAEDHEIVCWVDDEWDGLEGHNAIGAMLNAVCKALTQGPEAVAHPIGKRYVRGAWVVERPRGTG